MKELKKASGHALYFEQASRSWVCLRSVKRKLQKEFLKCAKDFYLHQNWSWSSLMKTQQKKMRCLFMQKWSHKVLLSKNERMKIFFTNQQQCFWRHSNMKPLRIFVPELWIRSLRSLFGWGHLLFAQVSWSTRGAGGNDVMVTPPLKGVDIMTTSWF